MSHANINWDPNEHPHIRYRLFARAIKVKGLAQMGNLYPHLQARLNQTIAGQLETRTTTDGN